jgi:hypothetical protein
MTRCQPFVGHKDPQRHVWVNTRVREHKTNIHVEPTPRQFCNCGLNRWPWIHAGDYSQTTNGTETIIYPGKHVVGITSVREIVEDFDE